ncbi:MAG: glycosyltransferase [Gemmataceae bacterium]
MRFSVIINTYNRAKCLRDLLLALEAQTYPDFEVIVVDGPSTDDTPAVLREYEGRVRAYKCPLTNLSMSRNIGLAHAAGEVLAYIDDDGVPDPRWLEEMADGFTGPEVAAVGGIVYDHTGYGLQYVTKVCDRRGNPQWNVHPPLTPYQLPKADPFIYVPGGNSSYRRAVLAAVGGFDEEIEYFLDETELCLQLNDRGHRVVQLDRAAILHKSAPSHVRSEKRVVRRPFPVIKNRFYFALQTARRDGSSVLDAVRDATKFADEFLQHGRNYVADGSLTPAEHARFVADIEAAVKAGLERGLTGTRKGVTVPPADPAAFLRFPTRRAAGRRLTVCFVSSNYPPEPLGGIGRYTHALATGLADLGHEVHVIARSPDHNRVDVEDRVWVHRMVPQTDGAWAKPGQPPLVRRVLGWAAAAHAEVKRIAATRPLDVVSVPIWDVEGLFCQLDDGLTTVLNLQTTLKTAVDLNPTWQDDPGVAQLLALEREAVRTARHLIAPSRDVLAKARADYGRLAATPTVIPFGLPDRPAAPAAKTPGRVRVLTVGRLERRKGTDLFLAAAAELLPEFPDLEFVLVGNDAIPVEGLGGSYREWFEREHGKEPWAGRVAFRGPVPEADLYAEYAACDVFCLPARYESFGLVLVEAMMLGKPAVATAAGGMAEIVEDGATGFLVFPDSPASLTAALRRLASDPALRERQGRAARRAYEARFAAPIMTRSTAAAYAAATAPAARSAAA